MKNSDCINHKIELSILGDLPDLKHQFHHIVGFGHLSIIAKRMQEGNSEHEAIEGYTKQIDAALLALSGGTEFQYDGVKRVYYKLDRTLRRRFLDYFEQTEAEVLSHKVGIKIQPFVLFLYKAYVFESIPEDKPLPETIKLFADIIAPTEDMTSEERLIYKLFKRCFDFRNDLSPESRIIIMDILDIFKRILKPGEYQYAVAKYIEGCSHRELAAIFEITEGSSRVKGSRIDKKLVNNPELQRYLME